jgi:hypothetical protein
LEDQTKKAMEATKIETGRFLARCGECGRWQDLTPKAHRVEEYFEVWEAEFRCCDRDQTAVFTLEKDYLDFH